MGIMPKTKSIISQIIELRNICNVNNVTYINHLVTSPVSFRKSQTIETNVYVLYVWLRICELIAEKNNVLNEYNEEDYNQFIEKNELTEEKIIKFARIQEVQPFIVVGRIQKEKNDFKFCYKLKTRYKWE